jgi:ribosomal protein S18 acetylase RimI-like enzyme
MAQRRAAGGRLLFAAVLPQFRGQGVGRQLLRQALADARQQGWQQLTVGPLPTTAPGSAFLESFGAEARQTYLLYQRDL